MIIGHFSKRIINALNLDITEGTPIHLGTSNINHMIKNHPRDYTKYEIYLPDIISTPDYVGTDNSDGSIELIKYIQSGAEQVKVAVRVSYSNLYYARTLYTITQQRLDQYIKAGSLRKP